MTKQILTASSCSRTRRSTCGFPGGGGVNRGDLLVIQAVALLNEGKNKNHFLSSMYLGVLINCAADYLFHVTI